MNSKMSGFTTSTRSRCTEWAGGYHYFQTFRIKSWEAVYQDFASDFVCGWNSEPCDSRRLGCFCRGGE